MSNFEDPQRRRSNEEPRARPHSPSESEMSPSFEPEGFLPSFRSQADIPERDYTYDPVRRFTELCTFSGNEPTPSNGSRERISSTIPWHVVRSVLTLTPTGRSTLSSLEQHQVPINLQSKQGTFHQGGVIHIEAHDLHETAIAVAHEAVHADRRYRGLGLNPLSCTKREFVSQKLIEETLACLNEYMLCIEMLQAGHGLSYRPRGLEHFHGVYERSLNHALARKKPEDKAKEQATTALFFAIKRLIPKGVPGSERGQTEPLTYPEYYGRMWENLRGN